MHSTDWRTGESLGGNKADAAAPVNGNNNNNNSSNNNNNGRNGKKQQGGRKQQQQQQQPPYPQHQLQHHHQHPAAAAAQMQAHAGYPPAGGYHQHHHQHHHHGAPPPGSYPAYPPVNPAAAATTAHGYPYGGPAAATQAPDPHYGAYSSAPYHHHHHHHHQYHHHHPPPYPQAPAHYGAPPPHPHPQAPQQQQQQQAPPPQPQPQQQAAPVPSAARPLASAGRRAWAAGSSSDTGSDGPSSSRLSSEPAAGSAAGEEPAAGVARKESALSASTGEKPARAKLLGVLNKLSETRYKEGLQAVHVLCESGELDVPLLVSLLYDQSVEMPAFAGLYSRLCVDLAQRYASPQDTDALPANATAQQKKEHHDRVLKRSPFSRELVQRCKNEFALVLRMYGGGGLSEEEEEEEEAKKEDGTTGGGGAGSGVRKGEDEEEEEEEEEEEVREPYLTVKAQKALLAFIAELYKQGVIGVNVIVRVLKALYNSGKAAVEAGNAEPAQIELYADVLPRVAQHLYACADHKERVVGLYRLLEELPRDKLVTRTKVLVQKAVEKSPMEKEAERERRRLQIKAELARGRAN